MLSKSNFFVVFFLIFTASQANSSVKGVYKRENVINYSNFILDSVSDFYAYDIEPFEFSVEIRSYRYSRVLSEFSSIVRYLPPSTGEAVSRFVHVFDQPKIYTTAVKNAGLGFDVGDTKKNCLSRGVVDRDRGRIDYFIYTYINLDHFEYSECIHNELLKMYSINISYADWLGISEDNSIELSRFVDYIVVNSFWNCRSVLSAGVSDSSRQCIEGELSEYFGD
ncbi:hypothetical protein [Stappia sp.]|uniref:hypothetical protein n=1 Tax=Stappia sp. TaxID=1870903 RepID=UPI003C7A83DB